MTAATDHRRYDPDGRRRRVLRRYRRQLLRARRPSTSLMEPPGNELTVGSRKPVIYSSMARGDIFQFAAFQFAAADRLSLVSGKMGCCYLRPPIAAAARSGAVFALLSLTGYDRGILPSQGLVGKGDPQILVDSGTYDFA